LEAGSVPPSLNFPQLDFVKPSSGFHPVNWERVSNALSTFITSMNSIFHKKLDEFVIIYIDDILVYSKFVEEHASHLEFVLQKFKEKKLYANQAKNEFASPEMDFMGHVLSQEGVKLDLGKLNQLKNDKVWF
jgi:hypothetical protein